jgi:hypothetical protein
MAVLVLHLPSQDRLLLMRVAAAVPLTRIMTRLAALARVAQAAAVTAVGIAHLLAQHHLTLPLARQTEVAAVAAVHGLATDLIRLLAVPASSSLRFLVPARRLSLAA